MRGNDKRKRGDDKVVIDRGAGRTKKNELCVIPALDRGRGQVAAGIQIQLPKIHDVVIEIIPVGIIFLDKPQFPMPVPFL